VLATRGKVPKRPRGARVLELDVKFIFLKVIPKAKFYNFLNTKKRIARAIPFNYSLYIDYGHFVSIRKGHHRLI